LATRAELLGDLAAHLGDCRRGGIEISPDQIAPFLGIELRGNLGRSWYALPVHDEVIAPERYEGRVAELMIRTFAERESGPNKATLKILRASGEAGRNGGG